MKKKWIAAILAVVLCLTACGKKTAKPAATLPAAQAAPTETAAPATEAPTEPATEEPTEPETEAAAEPETEAATEPETEAPTEPETTAPSGIRPEFKEAMDSYEAFYNEYCDFMQEYAKNPADLSMLGKYAGMLTKVEEMDRKFDAWDESDMSSEELKYYLDVTTRIEKRMIDLF